MLSTTLVPALAPTERRKTSVRDVSLQTKPGYKVNPFMKIANASTGSSDKVIGRYVPPINKCTNNGPVQPRADYIEACNVALEY
jgi:hypothetical protein